MVKLRAFIFDTVMHLYWGYLQGRNYASINNILKVMNFIINSHFALFVSFDIHAKITNFTFGIPHTHTYIYIYTQTHTDTIFTFCTFWLIWHTTDLHMHRYSDICTETLTHRYRYTETHASL